MNTPEEIARVIDHTLLKPAATADEIKKLCAEAHEYRFAAVCINPFRLPLAAAELKGSGVKVCTVIGFPLGATLPEEKAAAARRAIAAGAEEIDMVINIGALKEGDADYVRSEIAQVAAACREANALSKVNIETALLGDGEKRRACALAREAGADFVKTSTGFGPGGATTEDVALMAEAVGGSGMGVKAAGGIKSLGDAKCMIAAGATRIGASAGVAIVEEARKSR